ncbi:MAG: YdcF family protein [Acidobacteriota bacterium]
MFRCIKLLILLLFIAGIVYFWHGFLLEKAGGYLLVKDELKPADVIVVLGGEKSERVEYGVKLCKEGWARKDRIIMTGGPLVGRYTWAGLMKEQAEALGVRGKDILLADRSMSTEEDAEYTADIVRKERYKSLILVTSPYHSRRASIYFSRLIPGVTIVSAPVEKSWFSFDGWWRRPRDRDAVFSEYAKFIKLWIFGYRQSSPAVAHVAGP